MSFPDPNQGPSKVAIAIALAIPPNIPGIKWTWNIPLVSNNNHLGNLGPIN